MEANRPDLALAHRVQLSKAIHQFAVDGRWKAAWPLTFIADPTDVQRHGGTGVELESVLAYLQVQDDIKRRAGKAAESSDDDADKAWEDRREKDPRGKGKGKDKEK